MNDYDVFWHARYAHNTLAPLFEEAKTIEPSIHYMIEMNFRNEGVPYTGSIGVYAHWDRDGMFLYDTANKSQAAIDDIAVELRAKIVQLKEDALIDAMD